jgi:hypothetical protein
MRAWPSAPRKPSPRTKRRRRQTGSIPGDDLAAQLRIIALLDRCVKRVHIDMDDFSHDRSAIQN